MFLLIIEINVFKSNVNYKCKNKIYLPAIVNLTVQLLALAIVVSVVVLSSLPNALQSYAVEECESLAKVGDRVGIKSQITINQAINEPTAIIVQIKDSEGITVHLSWLVGILEQGQKMDVIQSWVPEKTGQYTAEVFIWTSVDNPTALHPVKTLTINVNC